jgi:hypothetical protein
VVLEEESIDYSGVDYQRSLMYEQILVKKNYDYYRDSHGLFQLGQPLQGTSTTQAD